MMTTEETNYKKNLDSFVDKVRMSIIDKIVFSLDGEPAFDVDIVPFNFRYSFSATLVTDRGNFQIFPATTSGGFETFWTEQLAQPDESEESESINSIIKAIHFETRGDFIVPFKMTIQFDQSELLLYCAEIYEDEDGALFYKTYDEMLFVFDNKQEAEKFEQLVHYA